MRRGTFGFFGSVAVGLLLSGCANVATGSIGPIPPTLEGNSQALTSARAMPITEEVAPDPAGFFSFCLRFPDQCKAPEGAAKSVTLNDSTWQTLARTNGLVNATIWPEDDLKHYGRAEYWTIPADGYGDCEDIALTKRKQLLQAGLPMPALRIAVVITPQHERHAVLTIVTDRGDLVLDNLTDEIKSWDKTGYRWLERQDASASAWVSIETAPRRFAAYDANTPTSQTH